MFTCLQELMRKYQLLGGEERTILDHKKEQFPVEKRFRAAFIKVDKVKNSLSGLRMQHKEYDQVFDRVSILTGDLEKTITVSCIL